MSTWGMRKTVGALGVAVAIAGVGGAAIAAATGGGHYVMEGGMHGVGGPPPAASSSRRAGGESDALHGEFVVSDGRGGFSTHISQTGRITAISRTSVTARSEDGFSQTYAIRQADAAVKPPFDVNDDVTIEATREGEVAMVDTLRPPRPRDLQGVVNRAGPAPRSEAPPDP